MNRVFLTGHLVRNPEVRYMSDGTAVANFSIGINERFSDRETGEPRENVHFVDCEAWGRNAELMHEYFSKGMGILIEGALKQDTWKADDGSNRSRIKVRMARFEFLQPRNGNGTPNGNAETETETAPPTQDTQPDPTPEQPPANQPKAESNSVDNNVPF